MRASYFLWGILAIGVGVSLFLLKYKVLALENELVARQEQVVRDQAAIRVLQAEWTYLNDPERLRRLSSEHLGFRPATAANIAELSALPFRAAAKDQVAQPLQPSTLPAGALPVRPRIEAQAHEPEIRRPGLGAVILARLQNILLPASAGAATPSARVRGQFSPRGAQ
ncbi:MAG: hypothetical protein EXQ84_00075 [Rhodospirillaceae bacterium]|nr:hypothetical protein [Rhodospirillaceae bacterium]